MDALFSSSRHEHRLFDMHIKLKNNYIFKKCSKVTFISIELYRIQIVLKQLHSDKQLNKSINCGNSLGCTINRILIVIIVCKICVLVNFPENIF